ncbi:hypothetical protein ACLKMY_00340 [Paraburkholderia mimosarum]|uniref:hypothetical protein n=1 Tax=Paraburkholderia mimosarum TaxID=312026 RepID=UPI0039C27D23
MEKGYQPSGSSGPHVYRLTGRIWLFATTMAICIAGSLSFHYSTDTKWIEDYGRMRFWGIPKDQVNSLLAVIFGVIATLLLIRMIVAPWVTKTVFIRSGSLTICEAEFSGGSNIVIPVADLRNVRRFVRPSYSERSRRLTEWARQTVEFDYEGQVFTFSNSQFRSNSDFEDFSMRVGADTIRPQ